jgi:hypothetical protein
MSRTNSRPLAKLGAAHAVVAEHIPIINPPAFADRKGARVGDWRVTDFVSSATC